MAQKDQSRNEREVQASTLLTAQLVQNPFNGVIKEKESGFCLLIRV
jgi:hypothetical protein